MIRLTVREPIVLAGMIILIFTLFLIAGCTTPAGKDVTSPAGGNVTIRSSAILPENSISVEFTCKGNNTSPPLSWTGIPPAAKELVLVIQDPDSPSGSFTHWLVADIPPSIPGLVGGMSKGGSLPGNAVEGKNSAGSTGYIGPCPPPGAVHRYIIRLYALDSPSGLAPGFVYSDLERVITGHELARGEITALFSQG